LHWVKLCELVGFSFSRSIFLETPHTVENIIPICLQYWSQWALVFHKFHKFHKSYKFHKFHKFHKILNHFNLSENIAKTYDQKQRFRNGRVFRKQMKNVTARHSQHASQKRKSLFVLKTIKFSTNSTNYPIPQIPQIPQILQIPQIMEFNIWTNVENIPNSSKNSLQHYPSCCALSTTAKWSKTRFFRSKIGQNRDSRQKVKGLIDPLIGIFLVLMVVVTFLNFVFILISLKTRSKTP